MPEPGTLLRPTLLSLHSGRPTAANEASYEGYRRLEARGESWARKQASGRYSNDFAMEFPAPPAGAKAPTHFRAICRDGAVLRGPLPAASRKRDPLRIEPGELALKLEELPA